MSNAWQKSPFYQSSKFLNDVNDSVQGGAINSVPTGTQANQGIQDLPGDRIVLDDGTAAALSDTAVGTLFGGMYQYVLTLSTATASPAVGSIAFFRAADIGSTTTTPYIATSDAQPLTTLPTFIWGIFINAITKGNFGWIQTQGIASVLYDSTTTSTVLGNMVYAKDSASVASTANNTTVTNPTSPILAAVIGVSVATAATSTVAKVAITRSCPRI